MPTLPTSFSRFPVLDKVYGIYDPLLQQRDQQFADRWIPAFSKPMDGEKNTPRWVAEQMGLVPPEVQPTGGRYTEPQGGVTDVSPYVGAVAAGVGLLADAYNTAHNYNKNTFEDSPVEVPTSQQGLGRLSRQQPLPRLDSYDFGAQDFFACGGKAGHKYGHGGGWVDALGSTVTGATAGAAFGPIGAVVGGAVGLGSNLVGQAVRNINAQREADIYDRERRQQEANLAYALGLGSAQIGHDRNAYFDRYYVHADGGPMRSVMDGGNGVTKVEAGGSHERNSLGGVPMGMAPDGLPNLVEEGEVKWEKENYIFSKRLKPTKRLLKDHVLTNKKWEGKSYAEIAEAIQKGSEERENDPTARQTVDELLGRLMDAQEETRMEKAMREMQKAMEAMSPEEQAAFLGSMMGQPLMQPVVPPQAPMQQPMGVGIGQGMMQPETGYSEPVAEGQPVGYEQAPMMAMGGHLFPDGGKPYGQTLNYERGKVLYTRGPNGELIAIPDNAESAEYLRKRQYLLDHWDDADNEVVKKFKDTYIKSINEYNKSRKGWKNYSLDGADGTIKFTKDYFEKGSADGKVGAIHNGIVALDVPQEPAAPAAPATPVTDAQTGIRYYIRNGNNYELIGDPAAYNQWVMSHAQYSSPSKFRTPTENGVNYTDYFVMAPQEAQPIPPFPKYSPWPGIANAGVALLGAWNVPDYEKANTLDTYRPRPMDYVPIGNHLAYDPMDMDYLANGMRAGAAGTRAAINNRISPSTGAEQLAADFNFVNGLGNAYEQVRQFNDKDRASVAEFNRGTDQYNATAANEAEKVNFGLNQYDWDRVQKVADARDAASTLSSTANSQAVTTAMGNLGEAYKDWYNTQGLGWLVEQNMFPGVTLGRRRKA